MDNPLVSVIMIFLNAEPFIAEAIESVLAQTYPHWELLLVDDGSADGGTAIAQQYAAQRPQQIRYLTHPNRENRGMSASRNAGIAASQGEYIALLDADDVYLPEKLATQVEILATQPEAAMVYGPIEYWFSWQDGGEPDRLHRLGVTPNRLYAARALFKAFLLDRVSTPGTCALLMRREAVLAVGGFETAFRGMYEDQVFFYKFCHRWPVYVEGDCTSRYRQHPDSACYVAEREGFWTRRRQPNPAEQMFLLWVEQFLRAKGEQETAVWRRLNQQLKPYRHPYWYQVEQGWQRIYRWLAHKWYQYEALWDPQKVFENKRPN